MTYPGNRDIALGHRVIRRRGRNTSVGGSYELISNGGMYQSPQVGSEKQLRVKAGGHANDTAGGAGARKIKLTGINALGVEVTATLETAGTSASALSVDSFLRLLEAEVLESGTYATITDPSHYGVITIEDDEGNDWGRIDGTDISRSVSQIGVHIVQKGCTATIDNIVVSNDTDKKVSMALFARLNVLQAVPPYAPMKLLGELPDIRGTQSIPLPIPLGPFPEYTEIGVFAVCSAGTADVSASYVVTEYTP